MTEEKSKKVVSSAFLYPQPTKSAKKMSQPTKVRNPIASVLDLKKWGINSLASLLFAAVVAASAIAGVPGTLGDTTADRVLGQVDFVHRPPNHAAGDVLSNPVATALDTSVVPNRLYIVDSYNNRVLGFSDADHLVKGAAADLVIGQPDFSTLSTSSLNAPTGVAVDKAGNLYLADTGNHRVLEYDSPFTTDTVADREFGQNSSTPGTCNQRLNYHQPAPPTLSTLCGPRGVAVDNSGHLYVADTGNNRVLEFDDPLTGGPIADRVFGRLCKHDVLDATTLCAPQAVALDGSGNLFVSDYGENRVLEYESPLSTDAIADRVFGQNDLTSDGCPATNAGSICRPSGVSLDPQGNLWVVDGGESRVLKFEAPFGSQATLASLVLGQKGSFTTTLCNSGSAVALPRSLCRPTGVTSDSAGNVYIADSSNNRVLRYPSPRSSDQIPDLVLGQKNFTHNAPNGPNHSGLSFPRSLAIDKSVFPSRLYVADSGNNRVLGFKNAESFANGALADLVFGQPDFSTTNSNGANPTASTLSSPTAVAVDSSGNLYVSDSANHRVLEFDSPFTTDTVADRVLGQQDFVSAKNDCPPATSSLSSLCGAGAVAVDSAGNLYVADFQRVLEYDAPLKTGQAANREFKGKTNASGICLPGPTSPCEPQTLATDGANNLYVVTSNCVYEYDDPIHTDATPDRAIGACGQAISPVTYLYYPSGVAIDLSGKLYIADTYSNRVLEIDNPLTNPTLSRIFGQLGSFDSTICNNGGISADSLCFPGGVAVDGPGNVFIADSNNNRVLAYDQTPQARVVLSPNPLDFGTVIVGTKRIKTVQLSNIQTVPLHIASISTGGDFTQTNHCGSNLAPYSSCSIRLSFLPSASGTRAAKLSVSDDVSGSPQTVSLKGSGIGAIAASPSSLAFGSQQLGNLSAPQNVTLNNSNSKVIVINGISISGDYSKATTCGSSLGTHSNCTVQVRFKPSTTGSRPGSLTVSFAGAGSPIKVSLSGTGLGAGR